MIGYLFRKMSLLGGWLSGSRVSWLWQPSRPVMLCTRRGDSGGGCT